MVDFSKYLKNKPKEKETIQKDIKAKFIKTLAQWNEEDQTFTNVREKVQEKTISMAICHRPNGTTVKFTGGPTGYEEYYIEHLLSTDRQKRSTDCFVICVGTTNSYARCEVPWSEVVEFIKQARKEE